MHRQTARATMRGAFAARSPALAFHRTHAHTHPRHLRHLHGWPCADRARGWPSRHRLRRRRLSPHEHSARRAGDRARRGVRRRPDRARAGPLRHRQRGDPRQPADGGDPRPRAAIRLRSPVVGGEHPAGEMGARRGRHPRQDDDGVDARVDPRALGVASGISHRRHSAELRPLGAAGGTARRFS